MARPSHRPQSRTANGAGGVVAATYWPVRMRVLVLGHPLLQFGAEPSHGDPEILSELAH